MSLADAYRRKAAELAAMAARESSPESRASFENLERGYLRLAIEAEKNAPKAIASAVAHKIGHALEGR